MFYVPKPVRNYISINENDQEIVAAPSDIGSSPSTYSYQSDLEILLNKDSNTARNHVFDGGLKISKIRSLYWKTLLGIYPTYSSDDWITLARETRKKYDDLKSTFFVDPHASNCIPGDNPLSQNKDSIWYRYFCDEELKRVIRQDVSRTGKGFFQLPRIQEVMINVLFLYARQNPDICYRQGMHEILAPMILIIHEDCRSFSKEKSNFNLNVNLSEIMDVRYLEHDVFCLFSFVMRHMKQYYQINSVPDASGHFPAQENGQFLNDYIPTESAVSIRLNKLRSELQQYDRLLYDHLTQLNIPFTAFGIRWLRLLFGREFQLPELLVLWDAIFAFSPDLVLVNHILLAMLIGIRHKLLNSEYVDCLNHLMKYPSNVEVLLVIKYALYLKEPKIFEKPSLSTSLESSHFPVENGYKNLSKQSTSTVTKSKNVATNSSKKSHKNSKYDVVDEFSNKTYEMVVSELKHMRVVMSLCKLKLYQYHEILRTSISENDIPAQQALTGIHELCTLLDIDPFTLKSPSTGSADIEVAREAGDMTNSTYSERASPISSNSMDAVAMYLPPPNTDIDMTIFSRSECRISDPGRFPAEDPLKLMK